MPEEVTTSVALLRLPPVDDVPPPLRGVVSLALRFGFTGSPEQGEALLAPMRRIATPVLDSVGPMSYAAVDGIHMDPPEPLPAVARGGLLHSMPADLVDTLLAVAGPDVERAAGVVELRLMGGALSRPATVPNAVAGRDGAYSLSVIAPAPPPLPADRPRGDGRRWWTRWSRGRRARRWSTSPATRPSRAGAGRRTCWSGCVGSRRRWIPGTSSAAGSAAAAVPAGAR